MVIIGLTGGIATGKSTVAAMLEERGAAIVDADELAHAVAQPGQAAFDAIVARFGSDILLPDGTLDRAHLARIVFADEAARRELEAITHPRVRELIAERVREAIKAGAEVVVVDIPLLFESGRDSQFAGVLVVYASPDVQLLRLRERSGLDDDEARARLAAQLPIDEKKVRATWVIDNSGSRSSTRDQVSRWWEEVIAHGSGAARQG